MFADIRGFTLYSESRSPEDVARHLNRFYATATKIFAHHDAVIDKMVGDEVMGLWLPGFAGREQYIEKIVSAAEALLRVIGFGGGGEPWLPLGLGLDTGMAFVGNVGDGVVKDFTAIKMSSTQRGGVAVASPTRPDRDVGACLRARRQRTLTRRAAGAV